MESQPEQTAIDTVLNTKVRMDLSTPLNIIPLATLRVVTGQLQAKLASVNATGAAIKERGQAELDLGSISRRSESTFLGTRDGWLADDVQKQC